MSSLMQAYTNVAVKYGKVDPTSRKAILKFFQVTLPSYSPKKQQAIVDELFQESVGTTGHAPAKSTKKTGIVNVNMTRHTIPINGMLGIRLSSGSALDIERPRRKKVRRPLTIGSAQAKRIAARAR